MNDKIVIQDIIESVAKKHSMDPKDAEDFVKGMFDLIEEALATDKYVKIKGLGTFKLTEVDSRGSVSINTGERIEIQGHTKISFTPDASMKDLINKPFAHFETVVLNENTILEDTETEIEKDEEKSIKEDLPVVSQITEVKEETPEEQKEKDVPEGIVATAYDSLETTEPTEALYKQQEKKSYFKVIIISIILLLCLAGGVYWYIYSKNNQPPLLEKPSMETVKEIDTVVPVATEIDSTTITEKVNAKTDTSTAQQQKDTSPKATQPAAKQLDKQEVAKTTLADTMEYNIVGTKTNHTLQEGESLIKIALKFYGTKKLWPYIVKHNKNVIKDANKVPIGTTIQIPELAPKK